MTEKLVQILKAVLNSNSSTLISDFQNIDNYLNGDFFTDLSEKTTPDFAILFHNLKKQVDDFYNLIIFYKMQNKQTIIFGGSFSSGKSGFINSMLGKQLLPYDINPATAVPTYVTKNDTSKAFGINIFNNMFNLHIKDLKYISHENSDSDIEDLNFSQLIKNLYIDISYFPFDHLVFLDTPGYSKSEVNTTYQSDNEISNHYYTTGDYLFWFVSSDIGTLTENDINILLKIDKNIPIVIIISKADKLSNEDIQKVKVQIKYTLNENHINYTNIFIYSKRNLKDYDYEEIYNFLTKINIEKPIYNFVDKFQDFFSKIEKYYNDLLTDESRRLFRLNNALTFINEESVENNLLILTIEIKENIKEIQMQKEILHKHKNLFFFELSKIAKKNNIQFQMQKKLPNSEKLMNYILDYKEVNAINKSFEIHKCISDFSNDIIFDLFSDITERKISDITSTIKNEIAKYNLYKNTLSFLDINYINISSVNISNYYNSLQV